MKHKIKPVYIIIFIAVSLICIGLITFFELSKAKQPEGSWIKIKNKTYSLDIADTPAKQSQGLSDREPLDNEAGMLFVFDRKFIPSFWMVRMHFPLDMIWIDGDTIIDITENVPHPSPGTPTDELPFYGPTVKVDKVLEINAGEAEKHGFEVGDKVTLYIE